MSEDFLPPLIGVLAGDMTGYAAMLTEAQARTDAFVSTQTAALTELEARFAGMGAAAEPMTAGFTAAGAASDRMAAQVGISQKAIQAEIARTAEVTKVVGTSAEQAAAKWATEFAAMQAKTASLSAGMAAEERKVAASWNDVAAAEEAAAAKSTGVAAKLGVSNKTLVGIGIAAAAVGVETVKMAGDFNMATERLVTSAGEIQSNLDMVRHGILSMAGEVGYSADELSKAMYTIESGGQHGAAGLKVLRAAAEGAKTENAELKTVADAVTSVLVDYHLKADDAAMVTSKLVAATSAGKTTFEELAGSMAAVLPVASANHVSLNDILGDLASMTVHGMSAQQAAQNLTDAIRHMASPTQAQSKELALLGINAQDLSDKLGTDGLSGTINYIGDAIRRQMGPDASKVILDLGTALKGLPPSVQELGQKVLDGSMSMKDFTKSAKDLNVISDKQVMSFAALAGSTHAIGTEQLDGAHVMQSYAGAMQKAMGDATGLNVALMIGGENAHVTAGAIRTVSEAAAQADGHVRGWDEIQGQFNQKLAEAKDGAGALAISIGEELLPAVSVIVGWIADATAWLSRHKEAARDLALIIGGMLTLAFVGLAARGVKAVYDLAAGVVKGTRDIVLKYTGLGEAAQTAAAEQSAAAAEGAAAVEREAAAITAASAEMEAAYGRMGVAAAGSGAAAAGTGVAAEEAAAGGVAAGGAAGLARTLGGRLVGAAGTIGIVLVSAQTADDLSGGALHRTLNRLGGAPVEPKNVDQSPGVMGSIDRVLGSPAAKPGDKDDMRNLPSTFMQLYRELTGWSVRTHDMISHWVHRTIADIGDWFRRAPGQAADALRSQEHTLVSWFEQLPHKAMRGLGHLGGELHNAAVDAIRSFKQGAENKWHEVQAWWNSLPQKISDALRDAKNTLIQRGHEFVDGLKRGATDKWNDFKAWLDSLPHKIMDTFRDAKNWLLGRGHDTVNGYHKGATDKWNDFKAWLDSLPGKITKVFDGAGSWLWNAGRNLVQGLIDGAKAKYHEAINYLKSLGQDMMNAYNQTVGNHSPSVEMYKAGINFMQGLILAVFDQTRHAVAAVQRMGTGMLGAAPTAALLPTSGQALANAVFSAAGGPAQVANVIHLTVQGSVWTTQDLVKELQQQLLRHNIRNSSNGTSWSFA